MGLIATVTVSLFTKVGDVLAKVPPLGTRNTCHSVSFKPANQVKSTESAKTLMAFKL